MGDSQRENALCLFKWGIFEEIKHDLGVNAGFSKRKGEIFELNGGFSKRKCVFST